MGTEREGHGGSAAPEASAGPPRAGPHATDTGCAALPAGRLSNPTTGSSSELVLPLASRLPYATFGCTLGNCSRRGAVRARGGWQPQQALCLLAGAAPASALAQAQRRRSAGAAAALSALRTGTHPPTSFSTGSSSSLDRKQRSVEWRSIASLHIAKKCTKNCQRRAETGDGQARSAAVAWQASAPHARRNWALRHRSLHPAGGAPGRRQCSGSSCRQGSQARPGQARRGVWQPVWWVVGRRERKGWEAHWIRWMRLEEAENSSSLPCAPR